MFLPACSFSASLTYTQKIDNLMINVNIISLKFTIDLTFVTSDRWAARLWYVIMTSRVSNHTITRFCMETCAYLGLYRRWMLGVPSHWVGYVSMVTGYTWTHTPYPIIPSQVIEQHDLITIRGSCISSITPMVTAVVIIVARPLM